MASVNMFTGKWKNYRKKKAQKRFFHSLSEGVLLCENCEEMLKLEGLTALGLAACPSCEFQNFVPFCIEGYWAYRPLGGGGMGSVYKAYNPAENAMSAIKVLHRDKVDDPEAISEIEREIAALDVIGKHPFIASKIMSGCEKGEHFCMVEFVDGVRLDERISTYGEMTERDAVNVILPLISAVKHIYNSGLLYRDMKPENVMIKSEGTPVLFDFGLCLSVEVAASNVTDEYIEGSASYMPPERLLGKPEGQFSEIYSLGMLLFEMLSGAKFYKSTISEEELIKKHVMGLRVSLGPQLHNCRSALVQIVELMIHRDPTERYQSFDDLESDIRKYLC